ncbi:MAG: hypothetical protein IPK44_12230 [Candidatus Accumulibacter sp.]|uniref:hypothetical protein n=1 Tax=Accumulibacter sp. TaxID=2053492 RepID=UPI001ACAD38F|nr:hypothetical protein [Accumulibacter sp.]MBK8115248.1 hypothetical protein [Accumulibacter sp.]MBN8437052.1 hypothetical protein [Accumulibacter sp.]
MTLVTATRLVAASASAELSVITAFTAVGASARHRLAAMIVDMENAVMAKIFAHI